MVGSLNTNIPLLMSSSIFCLAIVEDSHNYITLQHNALSEWLHTNLCLIYEALDGSCTQEIGPLNEEQVFESTSMSTPLLSCY